MPAPPITPVTIAQKILAPNMSAPGIPLDPWVVDLYTDNIIKQTIDRLLAFKPNKNYWDVLKLDSGGRLIVNDWNLTELISGDVDATLDASELRTVLERPTGSSGILEALSLGSLTNDVGLIITVDDWTLVMVDYTGAERSAASPVDVYNAGGEDTYYILTAYDTHAPFFHIQLKRPLKFADSLKIQVINQAAASRGLTMPYSYRTFSK